MTAKALMVDVDGVVVNHPHPDGWAVNLQRDLGVSVQVLQERFFKPHFNDIVHGRAQLRDRLAPVLTEIAPHIGCDELISYWFREDAFVDDELVQQLDRVRASGIQVHLATAQEHERAAHLWDVLDFRRHFDAMHYAAALCCSKPNPDFFAAVEARAGFLASEILFIDDLPANVEAAIRCGWRAKVWTRGARLADLFPELK